MLFAHDPDAAQERVAEWAASVSARAEQARALADRVGALSVSASGSDGAVVVTVAGSGLVSDIQLDDRVLRWSGARISEEILAVMRRAQARLAAHVAEVAERTVGLDSQTGRAVVAGYERRFPARTGEDDRDRGGDGER